MGDRWVNPPTYQQTAGGTSLTVGVMARGLDGAGRPMEIRPVWIAKDRGMVTISPGAGSEVAIHVERAGSTTVRVVHEDVAKELAIQATQRDHAIHVEITPRP